MEIVSNVMYILFVALSHAALQCHPLVVDTLSTFDSFIGVARLSALVSDGTEL